MRLNLKQRLLGPYVMATALMMAMGASSLYVFEELHGTVDTLSKKDAVKLALAGELGGVTEGLRQVEEAALVRSLEHDNAGLKSERAAGDGELAALRKIVGEFEPLLGDGGWQGDGREAESRGGTGRGGPGDILQPAG